MADKYIIVPEEAVQAAGDPRVPGRAVVVPVLVDWPDLPALTEDQIVTNAMAAASGSPRPYPDPRLILIELPRVVR